MPRSGSTTDVYGLTANVYGLRSNVYDFDPNVWSVVLKTCAAGASAAAARHAKSPGFRQSSSGQHPACSRYGTVLRHHTPQVAAAELHIRLETIHIHPRTMHILPETGIDVPCPGGSSTMEARDGRRLTDGSHADARGGVPQ